MSNHNSPEYRTIVQCTPDLVTALRNDLVPLSGEFLEAGLITDDNAAALRNQFIINADRAAQLVEFVRDRVLLDPKNYVSFIQVLKQRQDDHKDILEILDKKYKECGGQLSKAGVGTVGSVAETTESTSASTPSATSMMLAQKTQQLLQKMKDLKDIMDTLIAKRDEKTMSEYCTIVQCTPELTAALKNDLVPLSGELLTAGLIDIDNVAALRDQSIGKEVRAARLMELVKNGVLHISKYYISFIQVLKQRQDDHKDILEILDKKYKEYGGQLSKAGVGTVGSVAETTESTSAFTLSATSMMPTQQFQWLVHELKDLLHVFETDKKAMSRHPECRTIFECIPELTVALKNDVIPLSGELLTAGLIDIDNDNALKDQFIGKEERAAQLTGFVIDRVSQDPKNYVSFIQVLKQRQDDHKDILEILDKKYKEYGGLMGVPTASTAAISQISSKSTLPVAEITGIKKSMSASIPSSEETTESVSSVHDQEQTCRPYRPSSDEILQSVPFIKPRQILEFDSTGAVFTGFDEIKIDIPPNAILDGVRGRLEVGVCLYGPFKFEEDYRPISPILWLCLQGNIHLEKPIKVTLPHILPDLSEEDLASSGVGFAKAIHDCVTNASGEGVFQFQASLDKASYYSCGGKGYGVLQTDHFCFTCLEAKKKHKIAERVGYRLTCVKAPSTLFLVVTYFLDTCLAALKDQVNKHDGYAIVSNDRFKLSQGCDHLTISCSPREAVNMKPSNGKIFEIKIDFWRSKKDLTEMKQEHDDETYPPRVVMSAHDQGSALKLGIFFYNVREEDNLNMEHTLYPSAAVEQLPHPDTTFTEQIDDWSDYEVTNTEVRDCTSVKSQWNLKAVHDKEINGDGITVAVLDTSVNINHKVFDNLNTEGKSFLKEDQYWRTSLDQRHGTMVAGIVANYAPKAKIIVCCVAENHKSFKHSATVDALKYLRDEKDCQVIVMSFGRPDDKRVDEREGLINELVGKGVVCVAAVGNDGLFGKDIAFPACLHNVIAVGSLDSTGFGLSKLNNPGQEIDVYAPGEKVSVLSATNNHGYQEGKGSSCAAPAIGGIVALLMQHARESGVPVNNTELLKKIFIRMKKKVTQNNETHDVYKPKDFFLEYDTSEKLKTLVERLQ